MNLASRLMEAADATLAKKKGGVTPAILCDEATYLAAKGRLVFDELQPIYVKGKTHRIPIYRPRIRDGAAEPVPVWQQQRPSPNRLIGRQAEWDLLHQHLRTLRSGQPPEPNLIVIEGDTGIGKSELMGAMATRARQLRLYTMSAAVADDPHKTQPFNAWRSIFEQLFDLESLLFESQARQQAHVLRQLPAGPEERGYPVRALQMAPLLNGVLPIHLPDNELTRPLQGEARLRATHELLLRLLPMMIRKAKRTVDAAIILIDNGHLLDEASLTLAQAVAQIDMPIMIVIASKILPTSSYQCLQTAVSQHIRLGPLTAVDTQEIVRKQLGVARIAPEVADIIQHQAEGHPLYSQAVMTSLRQAQQVQIASNECRLHESAGRQLTIPLPPDVQKIITYGVDRLPPAQQLLLKTAASLADGFTVAEITAVHPISNDSQLLQTELDALVTLGILHGEHSSTTHYRFPFRLGREAVYQLLLSEQRGKLKR
jgi:predicted ATPase